MYARFRLAFLLTTALAGIHGSWVSEAVAEPDTAEHKRSTFSLRPAYGTFQESDAAPGGGSAPATDEVAELARAVQNPIADLISLPFQNNTSFGVGSRNRATNVPRVSGPRWRSDWTGNPPQPGMRLSETSPNRSSQTAGACDGEYSFCDPG